MAILILPPAVFSLPAFDPNYVQKIPFSIGGGGFFGRMTKAEREARVNRMKEQQEKAREESINLYYTHQDFRAFLDEIYNRMDRNPQAMYTESMTWANIWEEYYLTGENTIDEIVAGLWEYVKQCA